MEKPKETQQEKEERIKKNVEWLIKRGFFDCTNAQIELFVDIQGRFSHGKLILNK